MHQIKPMNLKRLTPHHAASAFISMQAAIVLAVITGGAGLLVYEWHGAHHAKKHHSGSGQHHPKTHAQKTASNQ